MILSVYAPRPDLTAAAYLLEIIIAEFLFLGPYRKRGSFTGRVIAVHVLLLILSAVTGIPRQAGFPRFLWFFAAMSACIAAVCACYDENAFTLTSACVAGFATQHIANKFTLMLDLIPVAARISDQSVFLHALFEVLIFSYIYLFIYFMFGRRQARTRADLHLQLLAIIIILTCIGVNRLVVDQAVGNVYFELAACLYAILCCYFALLIQFTITQWQRADTERLLTQQLFSESKKQYEQWSVNAGMIKQWIHDLRHGRAAAQHGRPVPAEQDRAAMRRLRGLPQAFRRDEAVFPVRQRGRQRHRERLGYRRPGKETHRYQHPFLRRHGLHPYLELL